MSEMGYAAAAPITLPFDTPAYEGIDGLIGHTPLFCRVREQALRASDADGAVLLVGEPGTGKSHLAQAIHTRSRRADALLAVLSCRRLPEAAFEVELVGCVKGAVVGASSDRNGLLDAAHGGTVVIEDVEEMSLHSQELLLRYFETGEVHALGARSPGTPSDVRIVATARVPLAERVAAGAFRDDLRAALAEHEVMLPALRERRQDIPVLADYFARAACQRRGLPVTMFSADAHQALSAYSWPGNVAELRRVVDRLAVVAGGAEIGAHLLPVGIRPRDARRARQDQPLTTAEDLYQQLVAGQSFWSCVYPLFMNREITRDDLREVVRRGLAVVEGEVQLLLRLFNMPAGDQKRFLTFLRKYDCHLSL